MMDRVIVRSSQAVETVLQLGFGMEWLCNLLWNIQYCSGFWSSFNADHFAQELEVARVYLFEAFVLRGEGDCI